MDNINGKFIDIHGVEMVFHTKKGVFHALREINLTVAKGEFVTLIGHSGCGKSTLLNLIAGLLKPSEGVLLCANREIGGPAAYRALRSLASDRLQAPGALGHAAERLHREAAALRHIAQWPGMSVERGVRLLNALYLTSNLMVSRSHPLARAEPSLTGRSRPAGSA